ncbi:DUF2087 domain-containing protein [Saccharibacillus kuerlensis]|uniref:Transcriptional regulator n=1 Tax=Saccharibacillus kuerlensis TaxID=459527 RepID=A0ABQ2KZ76_9BACL|nr:DUF2087 domain-containing protein [Saccharibacillus kuerlensis]GGN97700.1 transcriptional regulator [Saccharibacillus kuerlensis]
MQEYTETYTNPDNEQANSDSKQSNPDSKQAEKQRKLRDSVVRNFLDKEGRLTSIPAQLKKKLIILEHLAEKLEPERVYEEAEINAFIRLYHEDYATIRREFIVQGFMARENERYIRTPRTAARRWEELS